MTKHKLNQNGASAIMFAMVFIIVISLLTVGFATLARRDQRAALDKTLSNEAQYAAEAGVESVKEYVKRLGSGAVTNDNCDPGSSIAGYVKPQFNEAGLDISCIKWDTTPTEAVFTREAYETYSLNQTNFKGFTTIKWSTRGASQVYSNTPDNLPAIADNHKTIIKVVTVVRSDIQAVPSREQVFYLVPNNSGDNHVSLYCPGAGCIGPQTPELPKADGKVYNIPCSGNGECVANIDGYPCPSGGCTGFGADYQDRLFFFMTMGTKTTDITYMSTNGLGGAADELAGIQTKVDVNTRAQDQSKRSIAYIPNKGTSTTWQPWFAAVADSLCKDIKVDGTNANGIINTDACPNN